MLTKIEILKSKARDYYLEYHKKLDNFSCGGALAEYISPELEMIKRKFNNTLDELSKIDPACTIKRL